MTTAGVKSAWIDLILTKAAAGPVIRIDKADLEGLEAYARRGVFTSGEKSALLDPKAFLAASTKLRSAGVDVDSIAIGPGAASYAEGLAQALGVAALPGLKRLNLEPPVDPARAALEQLKEVLRNHGEPLGNFDSWKVQLAGAELSFHVEANGKKFPAFRLSKPEYKDPAPKNWETEIGQALRSARAVAEVKTIVDDAISKNLNYFDAEGLTTKFRNEKYAIQGLRRDAFAEQVGNILRAGALPSGDVGKAKEVVRRALEDLISGKSLELETGTNTNYWPYWENFLGTIEKMLRQQTPASEGADGIANYARRILRRKTVFNRSMSIDEQNIEKSVGGILVHRPLYSTETHRVSVVENGDPRRPEYETLTLAAAASLPESERAVAGLKVYRDEAGKLRFDINEGKPHLLGHEVSPAAAAHVKATKVSFNQLTFRAPKLGEALRPGISFDWSDDGLADAIRILIEWWGHCHVQAPFNSMGFEPPVGLDYAVSSLAVDASKVESRYTRDELFGVGGALMNAADEGYYSRSGRTISVAKTNFYSNRNNGGHWVEFHVAGQGPVRVKAEVNRMWHKSDPTAEYSDVAKRFSRDLANGDGTFDANPDFLRSGARDEDEILIDAKDRKLEITTEYRTFDSSGAEVEKKDRVSLDPTKDEFVKISEEIATRNRDGGGRVIEYWYNAKSGEFQQKTVGLKRDDGFARTEVEVGEKRSVSGLIAAQETTFDGVKELHELFHSNPGLPFTLDTSSGMPVWNYSVSWHKTDVVKRVDRVEDGKTFTYTTYNVGYRTIGGPWGSMSYIIKRDEDGKFERALATKPMPDFGFDYDDWISAPMIPDSQGRPAVNLKALLNGFMSPASVLQPSPRFPDPETEVVDDLWRESAKRLMASFQAGDKGLRRAQAVEHEGEVYTFSDATKYQEAVDAIKARHAAKAPEPSSGVA